jgi:broad specificity phosphatase PhoE
MNLSQRDAPTLYLIRHGETDWNAQRRLQGRRDIPLNDTGRAQAATSGLCLRWLLAQPETLDFVASPLLRTRETMRIVRQQLGLEVDDYRSDERLLEIDFGEWDGYSWTEIAAREPERFAARQADPLSFVPHGGENYRMVFKRVAAFLESLERDTVVVAHAGVLRSFMALCADTDPAVVPTIEVPQDRVLMIRDGAFAWLRASTALDGRD